MSKHGYRYVGDGAHFRGVPARDLTAKQFAALDPLGQRTVRESGAYAEVTDADIKREEAEAKKRAEAEAKTQADDGEKGGR